MDHTSIDIYLVIDTFLLLLIGIGPKIALVPFVEATAALDGETKALIVRKMLITAGVTAVILIGLGELDGRVTRAAQNRPRSLLVLSSPLRRFLVRPTTPPQWI